jgi:hypothetical protein
MRGAAAAGRAAGEGFVHDLADGAQAAAALGAAAEAAVDLRGGTRRRRIHGGTHLMVAQDVAGTDNHETARTSGDAPHRYLRARRDAKGKAAFSSNSKLMPGQILE